MRYRFARPEAPERDYTKRLGKMSALSALPPPLSTIRREIHFLRLQRPSLPAGGQGVQRGLARPDTCTKDIISHTCFGVRRGLSKGVTSTFGRFALPWQRLSLQAGQGDAAHKVLLEYQKHDQRRDGDEHRTGHDGLIVGAAEAVGHAGNDERQRQLLLLVEDDQGPQVGVERAQKDEDGQRRQNRLGQGQDNVAIDAEVAAAVDLGGVVQFARDAVDELAT